MLRQSMFHLFYCVSATVIILGMSLPGCSGSGSTSIHRQHHLLQEDSPSVCVSFIRDNEAWTEPIDINLDGEDLLTLPEGKYTILDLKPGKYDMVITSKKMEEVDTVTVFVNVPRNYKLDLSKGDSIYILFSREKAGFWDLVKGQISDEVFNSAIVIPLGENDSLVLREDSRTFPGYGYTGKSVTRKKAVKLASELKPVGTRKIR